MRRSAGPRRQLKSPFISKSKVAEYTGNYGALAWVFSRSSHPAERSHERAMRKPQQHLSKLRMLPPHAPPQPPSSTAVVMVTGGRGGPELDTVPLRRDALTPNKLREITRGSGSPVDRRGHALIRPSILLFYPCGKLPVPRGITQSGEVLKIGCSAI